jgi:selT/selW/selH-like putative selenoprotein
MHLNFPELVGKVTGDNLPPPPIVELLFKLLSFLQLAGVLVVILGRNTFSLMGLPAVPTWYDSIEKNGVQLAIFIYLLMPQVLSKYMVTGAFEVVLDGVTVFSKLQTGRFPQYSDLVEPFVDAGLKLIQAQSE